MGVICFRILLFGLLLSFNRPCTSQLLPQEEESSGSADLFESPSDVISTATVSVICEDESSIRPCCLLSEKPMNWSEAHNHCHSRQGWLMNSMQPSPLNMSMPELELLLQGHNSTLWSGFQIRRYRLLADNFPIPNSFGNFNSDWDTTDYSGECVQMDLKKNCSTNRRWLPGEEVTDAVCNPTYHVRNTAADDLTAGRLTLVFYENGTTQQPHIEVLLNLTAENEYLVDKPRVDQTPPTDKNLTVRCLVPTTGQRNTHLQTPVIYNFGTPLVSTRFDNNSEVYWTASSPILPSRFVQLYHCDVFDPNSNTVLQSPPTFVRFRDDVIVSAHVNFNGSDKLGLGLYTSSLLDNWTYPAGSSPFRFFSNHTDTFLKNFDTVTRKNKLNIRPAMFVPQKGNIPAKLVMLVIKESSGFDQRKDSPEKFINLVKGNIGKTFKKLSLPELNISTMTLHNVHKCWPTFDQFNLVDKRCSLDSQPMYIGSCEGDRLVGFEYNVTRLKTDCDCSEATDSAKQLWCSTQKDPISVDNFQSIVRIVKNMTSEGSLEEVGNIDIFADIISRSSSFKTLPDSTVQDYLDIIDSISRSPQAVLAQAQMTSNATQKIIKSLENIGSQVQLQDGHNRFVSQSLALEVWDLTYGGNVSQTTGLKIAESSSKDLRHDKVFTVKSGNVDFGLVEDAIFLQEEIAKSLTTELNRPHIRLVMKALTDTSIFEVSSQQNTSNQTSSPEESTSNETSSEKKVHSVINSRVLSMQMLVDDQRQTNLTPHYVTLVFSPLNKTLLEQTAANTSCVYWDLSANQGTGGWARDGCNYNRTENGKIVCTCNHLTNFAIFLDYYDQDPEINEHAGILSIISIVGLSLSIFGLSLSIVSFLLVKSLRDSLPQKLMFQLSLALLFSWIVFLVGIEQTSSYDECLAIAILLHYLVLCSFMWMLGHGILQHMMIVQIQKAVSPKFLTSYTIIAWGFPIIPVAVVLSVDPELYHGGTSYCWMKRTALYYSFILPVGLIIITNIIIFIQIVIRLHKRGDNVARVTQRNQTLVNVRASIISFCILGLSWTFGFFAIGDARVYFQYLFCTVVSVQGFLIFAMMVARNHSVQQYWRSVFCYTRTRSRSTTDSEKCMIKDHQLKSHSNNSALTYKTELRSDSQDESSH